MQLRFRAVIVGQSGAVGGARHHGPVPRSAHAPATLAEFQDGEQRLLFARYRGRPDVDLYYLQDGTANRIRDWARTHLECFLPDCPDRWLTTVARSRGRDGFLHRGGAGRHEPEGLFHQQAKALLLRWAARFLPTWSSRRKSAPPPGSAAQT